MISAEGTKLLVSHEGAYWSHRVQLRMDARARCSNKTLLHCEITESSPLHVVYESDLALVCVTSCFWVKTAVFLYSFTLLIYVPFKTMQQKGSFHGQKMAMMQGVKELNIAFSSTISQIRCRCRAPPINAFFLRCAILATASELSPCHCHVFRSVWCFATLSSYSFRLELKTDADEVDSHTEMRWMPL